MSILPEDAGSAGWEDADGFYAALISRIDALEEGERDAYLVRLCLKLAHLVGDSQTLRKALDGSTEA